MHTNRRIAMRAVLSALVLCLPAAGTGRAAELDETTGRLHLDADGYGVSFDEAASLPPELAAALEDNNGDALSPQAIAAQIRTDPDGLQGEGYLEMGGTYATLQLHLGALESRFNGRRVEIRFWQRPEGTRLQASLAWVLSDAVDPERYRLLGYFMFQPSGRATDDGWEEWTSGPFDFMAAGSSPPIRMELQDVQVSQSWQAVTYDRNLRVRLDALEILDLGPAFVPRRACTRLSQSQVCGPFGACLFGRCVDAALRYGPALVDRDLRNDYLDRRFFEFSTFEGGRMPQSLMGLLSDAVETLREETSPARFWPVLGRGIAALRDGHASGPMFGYSGSYQTTNLGVCVHQGEADLLPHGGPAPLVFSTEASNPVADLLAVGDVLTTIDGLPPFDWAVAVGLAGSHAGDPAAFEVVMAPSLFSAAQAGGSVVTFTRCGIQGAPVPCEPGETETIEVDFAQLAEETLWAGDLPEWLDHSQRCDYRFRRGVDHPDVRRYSFAGFEDDGAVRTLIINGLPSMYYGQEWVNAVLGALDPPPAYLILDQRTGSGGAVDTTDFLMGLFLTELDFDHIEIVPQVDRTLDATTWAALTSCRMFADQNDCGGFWRWQLHEMSEMEPPLRGVAGATRVAVLNAMDVSGNDFTTKLFNYRAGPTRIFGPGPTYGAFGPIASLPTHLDELSGGSMQYWDSAFAAQPDGEPEGFLTGVGIPPDRLIFQKQSDALLGVDTTVEAARAWLLQE